MTQEKEIITDDIKPIFSPGWGDVGTPGWDSISSGVDTDS